MVKAVVFDMDDTIFYPQLPFEKALKAVCPRYAGDVIETYNLFRKVSDIEFERVLQGECDLFTFHKARFKKTMETCGYTDITEEEAGAFQKLYSREQENIEILEGIKATFDYLKEKEIRLGLLTNGPTQHQLKKIEYLKLKDYIEDRYIIVSQETGFSKPDKEIFDLMEKRFGLPACELLYVGDNYKNDIFGGASCGWKTVWINHRKQEISLSEEFQADFEISSHEGLLEAVQQIIK